MKIWFDKVYEVYKDRIRRVLIGNKCFYGIEFGYLYNNNMFNISDDKKRKLCDYRNVDGGFLDVKGFDKKSADKKSLIDGKCNDGSDIRNVDGKYTNILHNNIINDKHNNINNIKYNKNLILNKEIFYNFKFDETDLLTSCGIYEGLVNTLILFECEDKMKIVEEWNIKRKEIEKYISGIVNGEKCVNGIGNNNSIGDEVNDKNNNSIGNYIGDEVDIIRDGKIILEIWIKI
ncbi:hypothetical protein NAPIS_ORF00275 [Vairimorpha apis BRL 01]|uniref:Uncharacterized protein n=1 Tax=Vairimorpha apis BRL 01 TaxID=1037528 RepID=T0MGA5_9MICR|nr:hypothetical protein NAPIS_ORF00275 [Vairimorpha apis BRL 01]